MKPNVVNSGRRCNLGRVFPVALVKRLGPSLFVDVGAAVGEVSQGMLKLNPEARVIAFEPFAGNLPVLQAAAQRDPRLTVRPVAVSDRAGTAAFDVRWVVGDDLAAKGFHKGSSVAGKIARGGAQTVVTARLDDEIREHVRFLKIDIQGGELAALRGAQKLIAGPGVDYIYIEFNGQLGVLRFLARHDYILFDSLYLAWPHRIWRRPVPDWKPGGKTLLSTGVSARRVWPPVPFRGLVAYCLWFAVMRAFVVGLQTDLLCVHKSKLSDFASLVMAVQRARLENRKQNEDHHADA